MTPTREQAVTYAAVLHLGHRGQRGRTGAQEMRTQLSGPQACEPGSGGARGWGRVWSETSSPVVPA